MFNLKPRKVKKISTKNRKINGLFPAKNFKKVIKSIEKFQNSDVLKQQPLIWDKAKNFNIYDDQGNKWIDFSSTIYVKSTVP